MLAALRSWKSWLVSPRRRFAAALPWARDLGIALLLLAAIRVYQQRSLVSGAAPALAAIDVTGTERSLATYRGTPVLLHFWATWCGACKAEQHNLDAVAGDLPVLSVASRSGSAPQVAAYVRDHAIAPLVIADPDGSLASRFGVGAFPTTFVIDGAGRIRHAEVGYSTELGLRARMWLARW